jgi:hypothetical protein
VACSRPRKEGLVSLLRRAFNSESLVGRELVPGTEIPALRFRGDRALPRERRAAMACRATTTFRTPTCLVVSRLRHDGHTAASPTPTLRTIVARGVFGRRAAKAEAAPSRGSRSPRPLANVSPCFAKIGRSKAPTAPLGPAPHWVGNGVGRREQRVVRRRDGTAATIAVPAADGTVKRRSGGCHRAGSGSRSTALETTDRFRRSSPTRTALPAHSPESGAALRGPFCFALDGSALPSQSKEA